MNSAFVESFMKQYNKDKEELERRFNDINKKLESIDSKFDSFEDRMDKVDKKLAEIDDIHSFMFGKLGGFSDKLENVKVYLSSIETKLNEYKTLNFQGQKVHNGELYMLKIKLHKIKPIINWENNRELVSKYKEIEDNVLKLEKTYTKSDNK